MKNNILFLIILIFLFSSCKINSGNSSNVFGNIFIQGIDVEQGEVVFISNMWQDYSYVVKNQVDNTYVVFWEEKDPVGFDIMGVVMNSDGKLSGDSFIVSGETENDHRLPKAVYNPDTNQVFVIFMYRSPGDDRDIRGRIVNSDGSVSDEDIIIAEGQAIQNMPSVSYSTVSHEYMAVWDVDNDPNIDERNIYGRRIDKDGIPIDDEFMITTAPKDQFYPEITYNPEKDQYMIVWEDFRRSTATNSWLGKGDIYGAILDAEGNKVKDDIPICTNDEKQYMPAVAYSTVSNLYFISFNDHRKDLFFWSNTNLMGRVVDQDGNLYMEEFTICDAPKNQIYSSVAVDEATGIFCVVWDDGRDKLISFPMMDVMDIYGRFYDPFGVALGEEFPICRLPGQQHWPIVAARGEGEEFIAVWGDGRKNPANVEPKIYPDIYGQIFSRQKRGNAIKGNIKLKIEWFEMGLPKIRFVLSHDGRETEAVSDANGSFHICGFETGQTVTITPKPMDGFSIDPPSMTVLTEENDKEVEFIVSM